ncbi:hypothetical protein CKN73_02530 [Carnobacterium divergens]|uniref:glycosyltransferase n=1 Tax=Carnobacterium divergens TaxID=2748 RepID=UPI001072A9CD|nr:glycosyltransferase [Carnobacterium divergens]TFJ44431.1 hypothetical protein CKN77_02505 [Carnobacterium divergens]TFJ52404.1 hypothetical protein CKN73_02530 [Carnobacterium divergens]TFJ57569.1 hypothetical protein CKN83_02520 [Carnobacterium divergens]TFJ65995.1 hypothetical protein CKN89_02530 [Carnobacterium divergens]TFJ74300.1 hypothetical protein CKN91_02525 [Carnobacterium divergens]
MKKSFLLYQQVYLTVSMTFIYRQLKGVSEKYDVIVGANKIENSDIFPYSKIVGKKKTVMGKVITRCLNKIQWNYTLLSKRQQKYYNQIIRKNKVNFIHAHFGPGGLEMLPIAKTNNIPLLVTFHGYDASELLRDKVYKKHIKELFEYAHVITVSKNMMNELVNFGLVKSKSYVHYIGVPISDFEYVEKEALVEKYSNEKEIVFLQVSNFVEKKGHLYTINAFEQLLSKYPMAKLVLAGDGILKDEIEQLVSEKKIEESVIFVGKVVKEEVNQLMKKADVFLHHSVTAKNGDQEGIPTVLMEAMAVGVTVVSTNHAGIPELITDGINGFLVDEKDIVGYVKKLEDVLLINNTTRKNARKTIVEKFNIDKQNNELQQIYKHVLDH